MNISKENGLFQKEIPAGSLREPERTGPRPTRNLKNVVPVNEKQQVVISYTNYKGISSVRKIIPKEIYFGSNQWHKEPQWLLKAFDLDKNADRNFAMADIHSWQ